MVILDVDEQLLTSDIGTQTHAPVVASAADATVQTENGRGKTAAASANVLLANVPTVSRQAGGRGLPRAPGRDGPHGAGGRKSPEPSPPTNPRKLQARPGATP